MLPWSASSWQYSQIFSLFCLPAAGHYFPHELVSFILQLMLVRITFHGRISPSFHILSFAVSNYLTTFRTSSSAIPIITILLLFILYLRSYQWCRIQKNQQIVLLYIIIFMIPHGFSRRLAHHRQDVRRRQDVEQIQIGQWTGQIVDFTLILAKKLDLHNDRGTLIKEMADLHFTALIHLNLDDNSIVSIEGLARVQMPHIQKLHLGDNNITSVGVIRKAEWPLLSLLEIQHNYFGDANSLVDGCFPHMKTLSVYRRQWSGKENEFSDLCFPVKMQTASLRSLCHVEIQKDRFCFDRSLERDDRFCFDRSLERVLQQRWPGVHIY